MKTHSRDREVHASALNAALRGIKVPEAVQHNGRTPVKKAVADFLELKAQKKPRTRAAYTCDLQLFLESLPPRVEYLEDVDAAALRHFQDYMVKQGLAPYDGAQPSDKREHHAEAGRAPGQSQLERRTKGGREATACVL